MMTVMVNDGDCGDDSDGDDDDDSDDDGVSGSSPSVKLWGKLSESLGKICCVRPHIDRFTFVGKKRHQTQWNV